MGEHDLALIALIKQSMITMEWTFLKTANSFLIVQTEKNIQLPRIAPDMKERWPGMVCLDIYTGKMMRLLLSAGMKANLGKQTFVIVS